MKAPPGYAQINKAVVLQQLQDRLKLSIEEIQKIGNSAYIEGFVAIKQSDHSYDTWRRSVLMDEQTFKSMLSTIRLFLDGMQSSGHLKKLPRELLMAHAIYSGIAAATGDHATSDFLANSDIRDVEAAIQGWFKGCDLVFKPSGEVRRHASGEIYPSCEERTTTLGKTVIEQMSLNQWFPFQPNSVFRMSRRDIKAMTPADYRSTLGNLQLKHNCLVRIDRDLVVPNRLEQCENVRARIKTWRFRPIVDAQNVVYLYTPEFLLP